MSANGGGGISGGLIAPNTVLVAFHGYFAPSSSKTGLYRNGRLRGKQWAALGPENRNDGEEK